MKKHCINCSKEFTKKPSEGLPYWSTKKFCSWVCAGTYNKPAQKLIGRKRPVSVIRKMRPTMFKKGHETWNKGIEYNKIRRENHYAWKGDAVGYGALHVWVKKEMGKACKCENPNCSYPRRNSSGRILRHPRKFEWANVSREYKRDLSDWKQLCASCHQRYDLDLITL